VKVLPLVAAPDGCSLTPTGLADQWARAAFVRPAVRRVDRTRGRLSVQFEAEVDRVVLAELIATERTCCSFLSIGYDESARVLHVEADHANGDVLDLFASLFSVQR
jgi:hypothetical protein